MFLEGSLASSDCEGDAFHETMLGPETTGVCPDRWFQGASSRDPASVDISKECATPMSSYNRG